jgi:hypothetical protein
MAGELVAVLFGALAYKLAVKFGVSVHAVRAGQARVGKHRTVGSSYIKPNHHLVWDI